MCNFTMTTKQLKEISAISKIKVGRWKESLVFISVADGRALFRNNYTQASASVRVTNNSIDSDGVYQIGSDELLNLVKLLPKSEDVSFMLDKEGSSVSVGGMILKVLIIPSEFLGGDVSYSDEVLSDHKTEKTLVFQQGWFVKRFKAISYCASNDADRSLQLVNFAPTGEKENEISFVATDGRILSILKGNAISHSGITEKFDKECNVSIVALAPFIPLIDKKGFSEIRFSFRFEVGKEYREANVLMEFVSKNDVSFSSSHTTGSFPNWPGAFPPREEVGFDVNLSRLEKTFEVFPETKSAEFIFGGESNSIKVETTHASVDLLLERIVGEPTPFALGWEKGSPLKRFFKVLKAFDFKGGETIEVRNCSNSLGAKTIWATNRTDEFSGVIMPVVLGGHYASAAK